MKLRHLALVVLLLAGCASVAPQSASTVDAHPKSIIFINGDGMGSAHFTVAKILRGSDFRIGRMPATGWVATRSANALVTDSAAAATAYSTGFRTNNRMVSVTPAGEPLMTAIEDARKTGRATGTVTTAEFFDATPAAFTTHNKSRYESEAIARSMMQTGSEVIIGGGAEDFGTTKVPVTLDALAQQYGYTFVRSGAELPTAKGAKILAVFTTEKNEVDSPQAPLPVLAKWAIDRLSQSSNGFFLLLENEGTDGASHSNASEDFEKAVQSLDETAGVALDYAAKHPDVLVIVTGDHETGGLQVQPENSEKLELRWGTKGHTGQAVPIFAFGPGASSFIGTLDNTDVGKRLQALLAR